MPSSEPASNRSSARSLPRIRPSRLGSKKSAVIGGVSMSCTMHVFPRHHAGLRLAGGEGIGGDFRRGPREPGQQLAFAGVGAAENDRPAGPLPLNVRAVMAFFAGLFGVLRSLAWPC